MSAARRRARLTLALIAVLAGTLVAIAPLAPALAGSTAVPGTLSTVAEQTGPLRVSVPAGVAPTAVTGALVMPAVVEGASVAVLVGDREAAVVPSARYATITVPLTPSDVREGAVSLSLRYRAPADRGCTPIPDVTWRSLRLVYEGSETPPASVDDFFGTAPTRIDLRVPPDADDDVLQAALIAVTSLSHRYPSGTPVSLSSTADRLQPTGAGQRSVRFERADGPLTTRIGRRGDVPTLVVSGSGAELSAAAPDLGAPPAAPGNAADSTDSPETARSLGELQATTSPSARAPGAGSAEIELHRDAFPPGVGGWRLHLEGAHDPAPGQSITLEVFLDDQLISSSALGEEPTLDLDVDLPPELLRSTNRLRVAARAGADPTPGCSPGTPVALSLDGTASTNTTTTVSGTASSPSGFQALPQSLGGALSVAIREESAGRVDGAVDAAYLLSALQRAAANPIDVALVTPEQVIDGDGPGLIVGARGQDSTALVAPLPLAGEPEARSPGFGLTSAFGALQVLSRGDRPVVLLGAWSPDAAPTSPGLEHRIARQVVRLGWSSLDGDLFVLPRGSGPPYALASRGGLGTTPSPSDAAAPTTDPPTEANATPTSGRSSEGVPRWLYVAIVLVLGLLLVWLARRTHARQLDEQASAAGPEEDEWGAWDEEEFPAGADVGPLLSRPRHPRVDLQRALGPVRRERPQP